MRPLIIDQTARDRAQQILAYARSHVYHPDLADTIPGDDDHFVAVFGDYKAVFTFTKSPKQGGLYRHLSVSVPGEGRYPSPEAVGEIAALFEFSQAEKGIMQRLRDGVWIVAPDPLERCVKLLEELK